MQNQTEHGLSKKAQIEALLCLEGDDKMSFDEIVEQVGTSIKYVYNVIYDKKSNGGISRAQKRWIKRHGIKVSRYLKAWRQKFPEKRNEERRRNYEKGSKFDYRRFCRYTKEENEMILGGFKGTDRELAVKIRRSVQAIQSTRCVLKKKLQNEG